MLRNLSTLILSQGKTHVNRKNIRLNVVFFFSSIVLNKLRTLVTRLIIYIQ